MEGGTADARAVDAGAAGGGTVGGSVTRGVATDGGAAEHPPPLIRAVRSGDLDRVRILAMGDVEAGVIDEAFRLAVADRSGALAQVLLQHGADPSRSAPDDLPSLRAAVDWGLPSLVEALLDSRILGRYDRSELLAARDLAREWHETGAEAGLRARTGSQEAAVRTRVANDEYDSLDAYVLAGRTVHDGHAAILTRLEELLGVRASFEELTARAVAYDQDHPAWGSATILLATRRDRQTWDAAAALRTHPEPSHRLFGAAVLRLTHLFDDSDEDPFAGPALDVFIDWSAEEAHLDVLTEVLNALGEHSGPRMEAALLPFAGHPDVRIRRMVAHGITAAFDAPRFSGEVRAALSALMADADALVRRGACSTVADGRERDPALADAMAVLLDDADRRVRVVAVYGLARHDDERCVAGARRLTPAPPGTGHEYELDEVWRYERRRDRL
ncbi:hypothetical protein [Streptomyces sp. NPDC047972]|uniref:hypothetical protein n=1 Tax=Streptomyces sp. NPDC047972 TaxID=3365493 RepID=UPI003713EDE2